MGDAWSRNRQAVAVSLWVSFLAAAVGSMLFFAFFDPEDLAVATAGRIDVGRRAGYALGFFFFWFLTAAATLTTAFLIRTAPKRPRPL